MNSVLEDMLRHYVNPRQNDWDELLSCAESAVNNAYQASTQDTPVCKPHSSVRKSMLMESV